LPDQEPLARVIGATRRRINQCVGRRLRAHRLNPQRFWVLVNLLEAPGSNLRELARRLRMDEPSASRIVSSLARRRLVKARKDPADRRRRNLELTVEGRAFAVKVAPVAAEVRQAVEAGFTVEEKETLRRLLVRVASNMDRLEQRAGFGPGTGRGNESDRPLVATENAK
jgi:DNA-binding MarR family transcriptional regulator